RLRAIHSCDRPAAGTATDLPAAAQSVLFSRFAADSVLRAGRLPMGRGAREAGARHARGIIRGARGWPLIRTLHAAAAGSPRLRQQRAAERSRLECLPPDPERRGGAGDGGPMPGDPECVAHIAPLPHQGTHAHGAFFAVTPGSAYSPTPRL